MRSSEEKKARFTFFKKNKKSSELSVDSDKSDNGSEKSGGFNRRAKTFNPFKSVRKAVNKYRSTRRPAPEIVDPVPEIVEPEPEPIDTENLEELRHEVCVVEDIRKNRPKGPQGRKRKSMRPCSTADGSQTPIVAQLEDLLNGEDQGQSDGMTNGNSLSVNHAPCKLDGKSDPSPNKIGDPPESDLMKSDVGNLASGAQDAGDTDDGKKGEGARADTDIVVESAYCTSALGDLSVTNTGEES